MTNAYNPKPRNAPDPSHGFHRPGWDATAVRQLGAAIDGPREFTEYATQTAGDISIPTVKAGRLRSKRKPELTSLS